MDLQENLHFGQVSVDSLPDSVDDDGDGGLGNPGDRFGDNAVQAVEDVPAVAELILDEVELANLIFNSIMPALDTRMCTEP